METYVEVDVYLHAFLTSALDEGEWSVSRLGYFTPGEETLDTHCIGGWKRARSDLDAVVRRKNNSSCRESNHGHPTPILVTLLTELLRLN
jgi:hypothetical protein